MQLSEHVSCVVVTFKIWLSWVEPRICTKFCVKLEHSSTEPMQWFKRPQLRATADWQLHHDNVPARASHLVQFFGGTWNHPDDSAPLQPRFGTLRLLASPKTKITFEREEISDHQWNSGKYDGAADGDWENYVRTQGAYIRRELRHHCLMYNVSCILYLLQ